MALGKWPQARPCVSAKTGRRPPLFEGNQISTLGPVIFAPIYPRLDARDPHIRGFATGVGLIQAPGSAQRAKRKVAVLLL